MNCTPSRLSRRNRGSVTVFFSLGMICLIGVVGVTLDFGHVAARKNMLQNYVDAKAVAALKEEFGFPSQTIELEDYLGERIVDAQETEPETSIAPGVWDFTALGDQWIDPAPLSLSASMVPARSATVESLEIPIFFGPLFGVDRIPIRADAIAFSPKRDVVIVQDVSGSMGSGSGSPREQALSADRTLVDQMDDQDMAGDRVGVVAFDSAVVDTLGLTPLAGSGAATVDGFIAGLSSSGGGGTHIPSGISQGIDFLTASGPAVPSVERILIVVGDGGDGDFDDSLALAQTAGNDTNQIQVYTIYFATNGDCSASGADYLSQLPQNRGYFRCAPGGPELTGMLIDIVTSIPMRLVQ